MDNDPTIKLPLYRQASPTDDTTIKLPPHMRGALKSSSLPVPQAGASQGDTYPSDRAPLQGFATPESEQATLEYEHIWDRPAQYIPLPSTSPNPPVFSPPPPGQTRRRWPMWGL